jgi:hypothetical protein
VVRFGAERRNGDDGHFDEAVLASAVSYGFRIVRWHPARS